MVDSRFMSTVFDVPTRILFGKVPIGTVGVFQALSTRPPNFVFGENKCPTQFLIGTPLARHPSGNGFIPASCYGVAGKAIGLACVGAKVGFSETVQVHGNFSAFDWTGIVGTPTLIPMNTYFLSSVAGTLTSIATTNTGEIIQEIGIAVDPQTLLIDIGPEILL